MDKKIKKIIGKEQQVVKDSKNLLKADKKQDKMVNKLKKKKK
jgi:hypothetical protein